MMTVYEGHFNDQNYRIAIVISRFNEAITTRLLDGAIDNLVRHGVAKDRIDTYWVPGAYEIPFMAKKVVETERYDGLVTLGAVIRGETSHYDLVTNGVANGVLQLNLTSSVPVTFGVVTTENVDQAMQRSGVKAGNKGYDTSQALLEMISLSHQID